VATYFALAVYAVRAAMLEPPSGISKPIDTNGGPSARQIRAVHIFHVLLAFCYSFVFLPLGVQDHSAPNMYSNLRLHGGSNHYLVPELDLIRFLLPEETKRDCFTMVRVEACTSEWINSIYPAEFTPVFAPEDKAAMASVRIYIYIYMYIYIHIYIHIYIDI